MIYGLGIARFVVFLDAADDNDPHHFESQRMIMATKKTFYPRCRQVRGSSFCFVIVLLLIPNGLCHVSGIPLQKGKKSLLQRRKTAPRRDA
jgi:hypothetical protein